MAKQFKQKPENTIEQINAQYGKLPPQAVEVEEAVLGVLMLEAEAYFNVSGILTNECFYKSEHQRIYKTIAELATDGQKIDLLTVTQRLKDKEILDEVGGPSYITQLTRRASSAAHIQQWARIIYDKFFSREVIRVCSELQNEAYNDDSEQLDMLWAMQTQHIDDLLAGSSGMMHIRDVAKKAIKDVDERVKKFEKGITPGTTSGFRGIDNMNGGFQPGELIVIGARPSMGKTAFVLNGCTKSAALSGKNVCFFSLEMEDTKLFNRLACSYGGIVRDNLSNGRMTADDWTAYTKAADQLSRLPIYIDDKSAPSINYIEAVMRSKARRGECDLGVVDYLQLIETQGTYSNKNREREVAEISRGLKKIAKALGIPIILLVQLNRNLENRDDKKPRISDIRESGAIEQDADIIMFPWRPEVYDPEASVEINGTSTSIKGITIVEIAKYREGRLASIWTKHNNDLTKYSDYDTQEEHNYTDAPY